MTSRSPSFDAPARPPAKRRTASIVGALAALGVLVWSGCGSGSETRYYCDGDGCYNCDAYGCAKVTPPSKSPCTGDSSCAPGSVCTTAGCALVCSDGVACPSGEVCIGGLCGAPGTTPAQKKQCTTKSDCPAGNACVSGSCQACGGSSGPCPCETAAECDQGMQCVDKACTPAENACRFSSECEQGKICADGQCLTSCSEEAPCGDGFTCDKGVCQPTGTECTTPQQCPAEAPACVSGHCAKTCGDDPECGEGKYCNQGACVVDTRPKPNCTTDEQCGGTAATPKKCIGGYCKYTCETDLYCRTIDSRIGYCAVDKVCRTAAEANAECFSPSDCENGKACIDNKCL